ncbi:MAG: DUF910 family protein [Brevibacillus sp.]|nr:DUF910 family protein [Brevibacillus sp.]
MGQGNRFDLKQFLRRFGILVYTGDPEGDRLLIEDELRELYELGLIDREEFLQAISALKEQKK